MRRAIEVYHKRLKTSPDAGPARIGAMYAGYVMGVVTSLAAPAVVRRLGGERPAILLGLGVLVLALAGLAAGSVPVLGASMFVFCGAMFLVHATASGLVNRLAAVDERGRANGLYVAFYYGGGVVGSFAPGWVYRHGGWSGFLTALAGVAVVAWLVARRLPARFDLAVPAEFGDHVR